MKQDNNNNNDNNSNIYNNGNNNQWVAMPIKTLETNGIDIFRFTTIEVEIIWSREGHHKD